MINHARCLLMNTSPTRRSVPYEAYMPPTFRPVKLPTVLQDVRRVLYGGSPDWLMLNYRTQQFLQLLHATELAEFVTALDPRVTYLPQIAGLSQTDSFFGISVTQGPANDLWLKGNLTSPDAAGVCEQHWQLRIIDTSRLRVRRPESSDEVTLDYAWQNVGNLSLWIPLPGADLQCCFSTAAAEAAASWAVVARTRPSGQLGTLVAALRTLSGHSLAVELFGAGTAWGNTEPFLTFRALWEQHYALPYQLGGLLLALIYRVDSLRRNTT